MSKLGKLVLIFVCVCILILVILTINGDDLQNSKWNNYKIETVDKYSFIKDIELGGSGPNLSISFILAHEIEFKEIEKIYKELLNQPSEVFQDIQEIHSKKQGGIVQIYITFTAMTGNYKDEYVFISTKEKGELTGFNDFKIWQIEHSGETKIYTNSEE